MVRGAGGGGDAGCGRRGAAAAHHVLGLLLADVRLDFSRRRCGAARALTGVQRRVHVDLYLAVDRRRRRVVDLLHDIHRYTRGG